MRRLNGGWQWVGLALLLFHFALPFGLLLSQSLKKNPKTIFDDRDFHHLHSAWWTYSGWWSRTSPT